MSGARPHATLPTCLAPSGWEAALTLVAPALPGLIDRILGQAGGADTVPTCDSQPDIADAYQNLSLYANDICRLSLGQMYGGVGALTACVPAGAYVDPPYAFGELISTLMPGLWQSFQGAIGAGVTPWGIQAPYQDASERMPGLFWEDGLQSALRWAAVWVWGTAELAVLAYPPGVPNPCGFSADTFRDQIGNASFELRIMAEAVNAPTGCGDAVAQIDLHSDGAYRLSNTFTNFTSNKGMWTQPLNAAADYKVYVCQNQEVHAARADYLLWWAARLLAFGRDTGSRWHVFMAIMAARAAMAGLAQLAFTIVHEVGHLIANRDGHCFDPATLEPLDCCTMKAGNAWRYASAARHGLPIEAGLGGAPEASFAVEDPINPTTGCRTTLPDGTSVNDMRSVISRFDTARARGTVDLQFTFTQASGYLCDAGGVTNLRYNAQLDPQAP